MSKKLFAPVLYIFGLATLSAYAQFPSAPVNETTGSFGSFKILVDPGLAHLFTGCTGWDPATRILSSPLLYDPATVIGVSAATTEGAHAQKVPPGIAVGSGPSTKIPDTILREPNGFPSAAPTTREVHTQIRTLNLATYPPYPPAPNSVWVRAGTSASSAPISPGEVESESPSGNPANDFPARSFFDMYVQVTLPGCGTGGFTGATLYNRHNQPLIVEANSLAALPPQTVYEHNASSEVPILFATSGKGWRRDQFLGCIILAGHQVGVAGTPKVQKGPRPEIASQTVLARQREGFEKHMQEAERHMPHDCKGK